MKLIYRKGKKTKMWSLTNSIYFSIRTIFYLLDSKINLKVNLWHHSANFDIRYKEPSAVLKYNDNKGETDLNSRPDERGGEGAIFLVSANIWDISSFRFPEDANYVIEIVFVISSKTALKNKKAQKPYNLLCLVICLPFSFDCAVLFVFKTRKCRKRVCVCWWRSVSLFSWSIAINHEHPHFSTAIFGMVLWMICRFSSKYKRLSDDSFLGEQQVDIVELSE